MPIETQPLAQAKYPRSWFKVTPFFVFCIIIGLITSADTLMSYITPLYIEEVVKSEISMGFILAFSSLVGFICDFLFAKVFRQKTYIFFLGLTLLTALFFPLTLQYLPPIIPSLILSTGIWGVYYEALSFTNFDFIKRSFPIADHEFAWGNIDMVKSIALTLCPILASILLVGGYMQIFRIVIIIITFASLLALVFKRKFVTHIKQTVNVSSSNRNKVTLLKELQIWLILLKKVWPLFLFVVTMYLIDSTFWSVGILLAEEIKTVSFWGGLMLTAYSLPSIIFSWLAVKAAKPFGKKRIAFILGILSGVTLIGVSLTKTPFLMVGGVFIFASFFALIWPEINATFENYISRLDEYGIDLIGMKNSAGSISYVIGPILAGSVAALVGNHASFAVVGGMLAILSVILLFIVPRKIKMPQQELANMK